MFYAILTFSHPDILVENLFELKAGTFEEARLEAIKRFRSDFMPDPYTGDPDCEKLEIIEVVGGRVEVDMVKEVRLLDQKRKDDEVLELELKERAEYERLREKFGK